MGDEKDIVRIAMTRRQWECIEKHLCAWRIMARGNDLSPLHGITLRSMGVSDAEDADALLAIHERFADAGIGQIRKEFIQQMRAEFP